MTEKFRKVLIIGIGSSVLVILPAIAYAAGNTYTITLLQRILIFALAAVSLDLILGIGGMVSFGHAAYFGLGAYVVGILNVHFVSGEPLLGIIPGTNLAAIAFGALSLRTSGVHFIMITLAFAQMLYFFFVSLKIYGGDDGLSMRRRNLLGDLNLRDELTFYYVCLALLAICTYLGYRLVNSRFGRIIQGARQNERRMAALGVATYRYKLVCFVIAGAAAGLAGALMANQARFVSPDLLHWTRSGEIMIMVILGGVGTLFGPILGAALLILLETVLTSMTEHWMVVLGPVLVLIVLFARRGVWGLLVGKGTRD
jgi:branched-chain amino acid transport system permease protein